jgi:PAS domain S-box-containing protein
VGASAERSVIAVLVVDDDRDHVDLVRRSLRRHDPRLEVHHVRDGDACLGALARDRYALVLLDYRLPRMTGLDVLDRIRALGVQVPVVMATGQGDERVAVEAMKAGAADYVIKTSGYFATLPTVIEKALKQAALAAENTRLNAEAQRQQERLRQVFDSTSDAIVLVDGAGRVLTANGRAGAWLGVDPGAAIGRSLFDLASGSDSDPKREAQRRALSAALHRPGESSEGDLTVGAEPRVLHWVAQPTTAPGGESGFTLTFHDVTEEREISRMKSEFISFVAHQLRTPLSGIKWMLELSRQEADVSSSALSYIEDAALSAERLITMVNDLLDVSRLESGNLTLDLQPTRIDEMAREVVGEMQATIAEYGHRVTLTAGDDLPAVMVDRPLFRQVIVNLVSNAVKYTPPGGDIAIRAVPTRTGLRLEVQDTGIGIPRDAQARLGEKFYRADNALTLETDGTGLGLYLARLVTRLFDGEIAWTSEEGVGTTFVVTLPGRS